MLKFIGSFYWLYKALNTHYEYKSTVHIHVKVCIFIVLCVDKTNYYICVNIVMVIVSTYTVVGRDYTLSNLWLAKEVNKELKKKLLHQYL